MYKEFIKEKYKRKVKGKKYYVIVDETEWGYYGINALRDSWIRGYKSKRRISGSFLFLSFIIVVVEENTHFYFDSIPAPRIEYFK